MPINEHHLGRPSNLTQEQQREAVRAVYGVEKETMSPNVELTYEERVKMRRMLDQLDQKEAGGMKSFDLNKPPTPPYIFREYPMTLYSQGRTTLAHNYVERQQLIASGWSTDPSGAPPAAVEPDAGLTEQEKAEAREIDNALTKRKTK